MRRVAVLNLKGGAGKTQSAVNLAVGMARHAGLRVLLVDLDRQGNASRWLLPDYHRDVPGLAQAMLRAGAPRPEELHLAPRVPGLTVLPASRALEDVESALPGRISQETTVRRVLAPLSGQFDVAVLDCPPTANNFVKNALAAAESVLVPLQSEVFSLHGLVELEEMVANMRELVNPGLHVLGFLHFAVDERTKAPRAVRAALQASKGSLLLKSEVRVSAAAREVPAQGLTVWDAGADARGAEDYGRLLAEVLERLAAPAPLAAVG